MESLWLAHGLAPRPYAGCFDAPFLDICPPSVRADQFRNAQAGVDAGVAIALHPQHSTPDAVAEAVSTLLANDAFRTKADGIRTEINAMPEPDRIAECLQTFVDCGSWAAP